MKNYLVRYELDGEEYAKNVESVDVGSAYCKILKKHPEAKIIGAMTSSRLMRTTFWIAYEPVSTRGVEPLPEENLIQTEMNLGLKPAR